MNMAHEIIDNWVDCDYVNNNKYTCIRNVMRIIMALIIYTLKTQLLILNKTITTIHRQYNSYKMMNTRLFDIIKQYQASYN